MNPKHDHLANRLRWIVASSTDDFASSQASYALLELDTERIHADRALVLTTVLQMLMLVLAFLVQPACTAPTEISFRPCDPTSSTTDASAGDDGTSSTGMMAAFECPTIASGDVAFDLPVAAVTRYVRFTNVAAATGAGPLSIYWHGTFESIPSVQTYNPVTDLQAMVVAEHGVLALPYPDMMAQSDGEPYPWWVVCGPAGTSCGRADDFELEDAIVTCAIEQGLVSADRVTESGMSAGGIQTSYELAQEDRLAGAVVWSGGVDPDDRPTVLAGTPAVYVLHGGAGDVYPQGCNPALPTCHSFVQPNVDLAHDVGAILRCNHGTGHNAFGGNIGAEFLARSTRGTPHPWTGFESNVGAGGWQPAPSMSGGAAWVLRNLCLPF